MTADSKWEGQELEKTQPDHPKSATAKGPFVKGHKRLQHHMATNIIMTV